MLFQNVIFIQMIVCKLQSTFDMSVLEKRGLVWMIALQVVLLKYVKGELVCLIVRWDTQVPQLSKYILISLKSLLWVFFTAITTFLFSLSDNFAFLPRPSKFSIVEVSRYFFIIDWRVGLGSWYWSATAPSDSPELQELTTRFLKSIAISFCLAMVTIRAIVKCKQTFGSGYQLRMNVAMQWV